METMVMLEDEGSSGLVAGVEARRPRCRWPAAERRLIALESLAPLLPSAPSGLTPSNIKDRAHHRSCGHDQSAHINR